MAENRDIIYRYGQEGLEDLQRKLLEMAGAAQTAAKQIGEGGKVGSAGLKALDEAARQARNMVDDFASRAGPVGAIISSFGPFGLSAAAGIGAFTAAMGFAVRENAQAEREFRKIESVIKAQGAAARVTAAEVVRFSETIAMTTMAAESDVKSAAAQLIAFRGIAGTTFEEVLKAAQDLAAVGFGSLSTNAIALGKALNDPANEAQALQKIFPVLTDAQVASIKVTEQQSGVFAAQTEILKTLRDTIGGSGVNEADTLYGAWKLFAQEFGEFAEAAGGTGALKGVLNYSTHVMRTVRGVSETDWAVQSGSNGDARLARERAIQAAAARDAEIARDKEIEAQKRFEQEKLELTKRAAEELAATERERQRERVAIAQAAYEVNQRNFETALSDMRKAAEEALKRDGGDFALLPQVRDWIDQTERAAQRMRTIQDEATRSQYNAYRDMWRDLMDGNVRSFEDAAKRMLGTWKDFAASMLAEKTFDKLLGDGGVFDKLLGKNGGLIAAGITTAIGLIGVGPRPSDKMEGVTRLFNPDGTTTRTEQDLGPKKDSPENRSAVNALDNAVMQFINGLKQYGLTPGGTWAYALEAGSGNSLSPFQAQVNNSGTRGFSTAQDAFQWVADQLVATIGEVPARLQAVVDGFDASNVEKFFDDLQRVQAFESSLVNVGGELLKLTDPEAWEIKQVTDWFDKMREEAVALGYDVTSAIFKPVLDLRDAQLAGIAGRYHPTTPGGGVSAEPLQETANWLSIIGGLYDKRIDQLQDEAAALRDSAQAWERVGNALKQTRSGLLIDPNLSPLSLEARRAESFSQLESMYQKAQGGDADAAAQLPDLARATLQASREFYRSSEDYYRDFERVQNILGAAQSYAAQQVDVAKQSLDVQVAILTTLQNQRGGLGGAGRPAFNTADVANITKEFQGAWQRSGLSRSDFLASDEGQSVWLPLRAQWISGISDKDQLTASLSAARSQKSEGGYASSDAVLFEQQVTNRMRELGFDVPTMHSGGMVRRTGLVYAEQGEHITPRGGMSGIEKTVAALASQIAGLSQAFVEVANRDHALLGRIADSNENMERNESVSAWSARDSRRGKLSK